MTFTLHRLIAIACLGLAFFSLPSAALATAKNVLIVGDSLSAAYGLPRESGWVALLAAQIKQEAPAYAVINASISGETMSGAWQRLPALLKQHAPAVVVIELGGNDALRGLALSQTQGALNSMVLAAKKSGARVLLIPMKMPPNFGAAYTAGFEKIYPSVAKQHGAMLSPFILQDFAENPAFFQRDRIHPTVEAQPLMLKTVWPSLKPLLK
jgi:acyl-CoA thioesterase I